MMLAAISRGEEGNAAAFVAALAVAVLMLAWCAITEWMKKQDDPDKDDPLGN